MNTPNPGSAPAIILFAHGARDPEWARPLRAIREQMLSRNPNVRVEVAFLEFMSPTLPEAMDELASGGAQRIDIVPVFMAQSGHTKRDLPALLDSARARHARVEIRVATPVGEAQRVIAAIAEHALDFAAS